MNFPFYIAKHYLFSSRSNNTINIISKIATAGVAIGTIVLVVVLSLFSGLREFSNGFLNSSDPDIQITASSGKHFLFQDTINLALSDPSIAHYTKTIEEKALFEFNKKNHLAMLKGVDDSYTKVIGIDSSLYKGRWLEEKYPIGAVMGSGVANALSVGSMTYIELLHVYVPKVSKGRLKESIKMDDNFSRISCEVIDQFAITEEMDKKYVYVSLGLAQELLSIDSNRIGAIEVKINNGFNPEKVQKKLQEKLGDTYVVKTRRQLNEAYYKMLNLENLFGYLIGALIVIIAMFNIIGAVLMMILDKKDNIKTLHYMGATLTSIRKIFLFQGFLFTLIGMSIGLFVGVVIIFVQKWFHVFMLTNVIPWPVKFEIQNILIVLVTIMILGYLAARIASSRISKGIMD